MEIHSAVGVFIFTLDNKPKTLLVKHKKFGKWFQPGGHLEPNENILEGALREVKEETGIDLSEVLPKPKKIDSVVEKLPLPKYILTEYIPEYKNKSAHIHQDFIYLVKIPEQNLKLAKSEHDDIDWFTKKEIENIELLKNTKTLLLEIFDSFNKS